MSINELFGTNTNHVTTGTRGLPGTAELTNVANAIAVRVMKAMEEDIETFKPRIQKSTVDSKELDAIIDELADYSTIDEDSVLYSLSDSQVESMLKSQQSKRSRTKSKTMTLDNYVNLLTAAIAEDLLRTIYNKPKVSGGPRTTGMVDYTGAQLEMLAADQEALRREIRNIQSKKSIMKSKAEFDESDERWLNLLKAEQQLKDLRVGGHTTHVVEVDTTKEALSELLDGKDISKMKSAEAHEMLEHIRKLVANEDNNEDHIAEEAISEEIADELQ